MTKCVLCEEESVRQNKETSECVNSDCPVIVFNHNAERFTEYLHETEDK